MGLFSKKKSEVAQDTNTNLQKIKDDIEEGTVELNNNNLLILSSSVKNIKNLSKKEVDLMIQDAEKAFDNQDIKDKEKYILSYKIDTLKEITI